MANRVINVEKFIESMLFDWDGNLRRRGIRPTDYDCAYDLNGKFFFTGDGKEPGKSTKYQEGQRSHFESLVKRTNAAQKIDREYFEVMVYYEQKTLGIFKNIYDIIDKSNNNEECIESVKKYISNDIFQDLTKCYTIEYIDSDELQWKKLPTKMNLKETMDYFENYWEKSRFPNMVKKIEENMATQIKTNNRLKELLKIRKNGDNKN